VRRGLTNRRPDVQISTGAQTWLKLREGALTGLDAYSQRLLTARGNLDLAVAFEGLFRLPNGRPPLQRIHDVKVGRTKISTLTMGSGPDVLLLHGLGGTRASFFETAGELSKDHTVHVPDLPGFGSSEKPTTGAYNAEWFANKMLGFMDALEIPRAHLVGNSMGGRISIEMGLRAPQRVRSLALLCPAVAFVRRGFHPIVRVLRPEFGILPHRFSRSTVEKQFWSLFSDRDLVDPAVADVVVDEFQRIYGSAGARYAFLSSARNIYLEKPFGRGGFYPRLSELAPPAMFVWTTGDRLIPSGFRRHVSEWLPTAEQITLESCGHVPQVERPEQTNGLVRRFIASVDALGERAPLRRVA
jgi:pimeloyl-ACP methyl ester carboxylesterase